MILKNKLNYTRSPWLKSAKNFCTEKKTILWLTFNPGLELSGFQTKDIESAIQSETSAWRAVKFQISQDLDKLYAWARDVVTCY